MNNKILVFFATALNLYAVDIFVIIPSYNNINWYENNLNSVISQTDCAFKLIYIDDCSTDGTGEAVEVFLNDNLDSSRYILVKNNQRLGAMRNLYEAIHTLPDNAVVVTLDGDDWFASSDVISKIRDVYENNNVWITFGAYKDTRGLEFINERIPYYYIKNNMFREYIWIFSHLRTFYAGLFKKINEEDLMCDGKFLEYAWDQAFMLPMLEMAAERICQFQEVLYIYNVNNPISDFNVHGTKTSIMAGTIRKRQKYSRLETLF